MNAAVTYAVGLLTGLMLGCVIGGVAITIVDREQLSTAIDVIDGYKDEAALCERMLVRELTLAEPPDSLNL